MMYISVDVVDSTMVYDMIYIPPPYCSQYLAVLYHLLTGGDMTHSIDIDQRTLEII